MTGVSGPHGSNHKPEVPDENKSKGVMKESGGPTRKLHVKTGGGNKVTQFFREVFGAKTPPVRKPSELELKRQALEVKEEGIIARGTQLKAEGLEQLNEVINLQGEMETRLSQYLEEQSRGDKDPDLADAITMLRSHIDSAATGLAAKQKELDKTLAAVKEELNAVQAEIKKLGSKKSK